MQVTDELVEKIAHLARLRFNAGEKKEIREDLEKMIRFVEKLSELDTSGVSPLIHVNREFNVLRADEVAIHSDPADALDQAPARQENFFAVPKVIKKQP
jgi:aspartyl-tRNA(Asn)/glutamyl-tRNA(Gln) amidotransferase subunit C